MKEAAEVPAIDLPTLQQWTETISRAQQMMLEFWVNQAKDAHTPADQWSMPLWADMSSLWTIDGSRIADRQAQLLTQSLDLWNRFLSPGTDAGSPADKDRRFKGDAWRSQPLFDLIRQSYLLVSDHLLANIDEMEGLDPAQRERLRFATRAIIEAISPSNFAFTNPEVIERTIETGGQNLVAGLEHMLTDLSWGQLTQTRADAFELGRNIASTPGKVVFETELFQLIQYNPTTEEVFRKPLLIFPPWINRFYILDLSPEKSFIRWAVEKGHTVFIDRKSTRLNFSN